MQEYVLIALWKLIPAQYKICPKCKKKLTLQNLDIHHKDGRRSNSKPENLQLMCSQCHRGKVQQLRKFMINKSIRFPANLLHDIEEAAEKEGISVSAIIRRSIESSLT